MSKLIALAGIATYVTATPIDHDGKRYKSGEPIKLDTEAAQALLDVDAIGFGDGSVMTADDSVVMTKVELNSLLGDINDAQARTDQVRVELGEANQVIAALREEAASDRTAAAQAADELRRQLSETQAANAELQGRLDQASADKADLEARLAAKTGAKTK